MFSTNTILNFDGKNVRRQKVEEKKQVELNSVALGICEIGAKTKSMEKVEKKRRARLKTYKVQWAGKEMMKTRLLLILKNEYQNEKDLRL